MKHLLKITLLLLVFMSVGILRGQNNRIDFPLSKKYVSYVGNDAYLLTDDEKYFLVRRWSNPSLLFEIESGKLVATGAEAFRIYAANTNVLPGSSYSEKKTSNTLYVYADNKEINRIKFDSYKNTADWVKNTGLIVNYYINKRKTVIIHPDGKKVTIAAHYSNMDKKDPKRKIHHKTIFNNLSIGYAFITPDYNYALDCDGRLINLQTGETAKMDYTAEYSYNRVYGSYDPETTILKVDERGDIKSFHLRTAYYLGEVDYDYYLNGEYIIPVVIPLKRSNSQLYVMGIGYAVAQACLVKDGKFVHYFDNPNVKQEEKNYNLAIQKRNEENAERLRLEEEKREWNRKHLVSPAVARQCSACNGAGITGHTAKSEANKRYVYEERNGNSYFKGTTHDTWPIICGSCFGRGYVMSK